VIKFERGPAPKCLTFKKNKNELTNSERWGKGWENKLIKKKSNARFQWHEFESKPVDHILIEELRTLSSSHCAFCDKHAPENDSDSIEHFYPKKLFPLKAYEWDNLFLSCGGCQKRPKGWKVYEDKRELILNPCEEDFSFEKYFWFDTKDGFININQYSESDFDKERAKITIIYFQLNGFDRPNARLASFKRHFDSKTPNNLKPKYSDTIIDELPYRFFYM